MATKLLNVEALFQFVIAVEDGEEENFDLIRDISNSAVQDMLTNEQEYEIEADEIIHRYDFPRGWWGQEIPYSVDDKETRTLDEILEGNSNMNKICNVNIKIEY